MISDGILGMLAILTAGAFILGVLWLRAPINPTFVQDDVREVR